MRAAINALPKKERRAFEMAAAGHNAAAIAQALGCSRLGAQRLLDRARWKVKTWLKSDARAAGRRRSGPPAPRRRGGWPYRRRGEAGEMSADADPEHDRDENGTDGVFDGNPEPANDPDEERENYKGQPIG